MMHDPFPHADNHTDTRSFIVTDLGQKVFYEWKLHFRLDRQKVEEQAHKFINHAF